VFGEAITQPVLGAADDFHVFRLQAGFLGQLAIHGVQRPFIATDTPLRELPGLLADAFPPEKASVPIAQDDAYIRSISITINHLHKPPMALGMFCIVPQPRTAGKSPELTRPARSDTMPRVPDTQTQETPVTLAIFDLDNTLIAGDSDYEWGRFLTDIGVVDAETYQASNRVFYEQYKAGTLDIREFCRFAFRPLAEHDLETLLGWRNHFLAEHIEPLILPAAEALLARHRQAGDTLLIITATNLFITEPIAEAPGRARPPGHGTRVPGRALHG
jgi:hypothetical protein